MRKIIYFVFYLISMNIFSQNIKIDNSICYFELNKNFKKLPKNVVEDYYKMLKLSNSLFNTDYTSLNEMYALTKAENPDHITFPVLEIRYVDTASNQFNEQFTKIETEKKKKIYDNNPLMEIKNISVDDKKKCIEHVIQYGVFIGGRIECFSDKYKVIFDYSDNVNNVEDFLPGFLLFNTFFYDSFKFK